MTILLVVLAVLLLYILFAYNSLVSLRMRVKEAWSQIDVQLNRRADLIPNLVATVKGYTKHEKELLENVTNARTKLMSAQSPKEKAKADGELEGVLKTLFAVAENYPNLRASENYMKLQQELADTEDKVAYARQFYNTSVMEYNTRIQLFPIVMLASYFKFEKEEFYEVKDEDKKKVKVEFN